MRAQDHKLYTEFIALYTLITACPYCGDRMEESGVCCGENHAVKLYEREDDTDDYFYADDLEKAFTRWLSDPREHEEPSGSTISERLEDEMFQGKLRSEDEK